MIEQAQNRMSLLYGRLYGRLVGGLLMVVVSVMSSPAWAQVEGLKPPKTKASPSSPKYIMMAIVLVLLAGAVVVVTLKTKRGHQD